MQVIEDLLTKTLKKSGYYLFSTKEYMSRVRGGENSTSFRVSSKPVRAYVDRIDYLFPFIEKGVEHVKGRINPSTIIIGEKKFYEKSSEGKSCVCIDVPFQDLSKDLGGTLYSNIIVLGLICGLLNAQIEDLKDSIRATFGNKGDAVVGNNIKAAEKGYSIASDLTTTGALSTRTIKLERAQEAITDYLLSGERAIALGAIAGGCNYCTFYPMSPSTGIPTFLSHHDLEFSIIVDQSEDEISVMNKAIGASYAGARAMVSTSGGGFALMIEGLSLVAALETPLVIHLGQRPAPATGMPTHTEQSDLDLALYAGHGMFPRILLAPGTIEDGFYLTQKAFNLAEKFQVPVFILTDQYFIDSSYTIRSLEYANLNVEKHFVKTDSDYQRYRITENGVSPRGIPGYGIGVVRSDSHTHDEKGMITEDPLIRTKMVDKFLRKLEEIKKEAISPALVGDEGYKILLVAWGSTYHVIIEALERLGRRDVALLHFKQVYPLHPSTAGFMQKAAKVITIEENVTGQFGNLLKLETSREVDAKILKYDGYCFSVEELVEKLENVINNFPKTQERKVEPFIGSGCDGD